MKLYYIVQNKSDDYGNCRTELVETTAKNAKEYYYSNKVELNDVDVLKKYIEFVDYEQEKERAKEERFY